MIRPEAAAALLRWREVLVGVLVVLLGLYWAVLKFGLLQWTGVAVTLAGLALVYSGVQRLRFLHGGGGAGIVQVVEGRITYFGPLTGGVVDMDALEQLAIDHSAKPAHWLLYQPGQPPIAIPVDAEGSERLFDIFAALPGMRTEYLLRRLRPGGDHVDVVWRAAPLRGRMDRLH